MNEKIVWFILAIAALVAALVFLFVQRDPMTAGVLAIVLLGLLQFRAQAPA
jgi:hypothetical protein